MRKKLFAALALQLAGVALILCFSLMTSALTEKYGKIYSVPCYVSHMDIIPDPDSDSPKNYGINFYNYGCEQTEGFERYANYKDDSERDNYLYVFSHTKENCVPSISVDGWYVIDDRETGKVLHHLSCYRDYYFQDLFAAKEVTANIKVYRDRVKLVSVTVEGEDIIDYLREQAADVFE